MCVGAPASRRLRTGGGEAPEDVTACMHARVGRFRGLWGHEAPQRLFESTVELKIRQGDKA